MRAGPPYLADRNAVVRLIVAAGFVLTIGLGALAATSSAAVPADGVAPPGLRVQGNLLVNTAGDTVQLRGVSRSLAVSACIQGWAVLSPPSDQASIDAIKTWRTNAVRVPLNEDCWLGINGAPPQSSGPVYRQAVTDYVNLLNQNGLYAILDLHWNAPGDQLSSGQQPMPDTDHAPAFWTGVASAFRDNNAVILELFNEPYPDEARDTPEAWACWRDGGTCPGVSFAVAGMQTLVNTVRATGATNVIALGGVRWSNFLSQWLAYAPSDPQNNLVASWHVYNFNTCSDVACYDSSVAPTAARVPVLATEIGTNTCDAAFLNGLMGWLDARHSGYLAWTWNTWGTDCAAGALVSDYAGTATPYGEIYRSHLASFP